MADCSYCHQALPEGAARCPRCGTPSDVGAEEEYERHGTIMEGIPMPSAPYAYAAAHPSGAAAEAFAGRSDTIREPLTDRVETPEDDAVAYRPVFRPSMALLKILDDGSRDRGETIRLRTERTVIGRTTGEVVVPHDGGMSGQHAEIVREDSDGESQWMLRDLNSRNGTFVRVAKARLEHDQQILIGAQRFRVNIASNAALVELGPEGEGEQYPLDEAGNFVGASDRHCNIVLRDDPFISAVHCKIDRDEQGRWTIENSDSLNGVWLRIESTRILSEGEFQLGEQRFSLRVL